MPAEIIIKGNVGQDAELRYGGNGLPILNFSVANNFTSKAGGQEREVTDWYRCTVFGPRAEQLNSKIHRGQFVEVIGTPRIARYTDREGVQHATIEVNAAKINFIPRKRTNAPAVEAQGPVAETAPAAKATPAEGLDEEFADQF